MGSNSHAPCGLVTCKVVGPSGPSLTNRMSELLTYGSVGGVFGLHFCTGRPKGFALISGVVANTSRNTGLNNPAKADTLRFEEALKKLEAIVDAMESEELPLETLLAKYEEGNRLAKVCQDKLAEAELKIQQLEKTAAGELKLKPLSMNEQTE